MAGTKVSVEAADPERVRHRLSADVEEGRALGVRQQVLDEAALDQAVDAFVVLGDFGVLDVVHRHPEDQICIRPEVEVVALVDHHLVGGGEEALLQEEPDDFGGVEIDRRFRGAGVERLAQVRMRSGGCHGGTSWWDGNGPWEWPGGSAWGRRVY